MTNDSQPRSRATISELDALHGLLAEVLMAELAEYHAGTADVEPALLSQAIKFLKDNGIDQPKRASGVDRLLGQLPDMNALEQGFAIPINRPKGGP